MVLENPDCVRSSSRRLIKSTYNYCSNFHEFLKGINYVLRPPLRQSQSMSFSVVIASKDLVDATFNKVLQCEINSAKSILKDSQATTSTDSFPFEVTHYSDYPRVLQLEKKFPDGEQVIVRVDMENIEVTNDDDTCEDDKHRVESKKAIPMAVFVHKPGKDGYLMFHITVSKEDILIQRIDTENNPYNTALFEHRIMKMDYEFQRCLYKYLEIRGITTNIASFLRESNRVSDMEKEIDIMSLEDLKKLTEIR